MKRGARRRVACPLPPALAPGEPLPFHFLLFQCLTSVQPRETCRHRSLLPAPCLLRHQGGAGCRHIMLSLPSRLSLPNALTVRAPNAPRPAARERQQQRRAAAVTPALRSFAKLQWARARKARGAGTASACAWASAAPVATPPSPSSPYYFFLFYDQSWPSFLSFASLFLFL